LSHSPYGRNPKTEPSPPPRGKTTTPEEARAANAAHELEAVGQESGPFRVTMEEVALVVAARDVAESFGLEPSAVALGAARVLYALADANRLSAELSGLISGTSPEFKEAYAKLDQAARVWLERRSEPKKKGRGKAKSTDVNPDAGHGAADGFGGSDFPPTMPGPDEGRPQ
jgi:hypothetical protein